MQILSTEDLANIARVASGVKEVAALCSSIGQWALLGLGGTLAMLLSTSYRKPEGNFRWVFIVFLLPAIFFLFATIERGAYVNRAFAALVLRPPSVEASREAVFAVNAGLDRQMLNFTIALWLLGAWLIVYAWWWIFWDRSHSLGQQE